MHLQCKIRINVFLTIILLLCISFIPSIVSQTVNESYSYYPNMKDGQILFAPMQSKIAYLINNDGTVNHTWSSDYHPGESVYLLEDGSILYMTKLSYSYGGAGGGIERISWNGSLLWEFQYYSDSHLSHHDIEILPNGNILMIAWEFKTREEAIEMGRDPDSLIGNQLMPDHIIDVEPIEPSGGNIVWEWHAWDHLIQDYDQTKDNYGVIEDHPELIDINFGSIVPDWLHTNSIDYNEEFDQILISVHNFNEIWVIDHSTTTEEAVGHSGGNSGKGGDILYRWGNPRAYKAGTEDDQKFFGQHAANWIEPGFPGEGDILVYNNGIGRPEGVYSSVDEIVPPVDENGNYYLEPVEAFGPEEQIWIYNTNFYSLYAGGTQRLSNGNTLICSGPGGRFIEVTPEKVIFWEYINPFPNYYQNNVFKIIYYPSNQTSPKGPNLDCEGSFHWSDVKPGETLNGSFKIRNIGENNSHLNWKINASSFKGGTWKFNPESGTNLTPADGNIIVQVTFVAPNEKNSEFEDYIKVENSDNSKDYDIIPVYLNIPRQKIFSKTALDFLKQYSSLFSIIYRIYLLIR
jgi:hypothetical protein